MSEHATVVQPAFGSTLMASRYARRRRWRELAVRIRKAAWTPQTARAALLFVVAAGLVAFGALVHARAG